MISLQKPRHRAEQASYAAKLLQARKDAGLPISLRILAFALRVAALKVGAR